VVPVAQRAEDSWTGYGAAPGVHGRGELGACSRTLAGSGCVLLAAARFAWHALFQLIFVSLPASNDCLGHLYLAFSILVGIHTSVDRHVLSSR
jgi:hypothetical protein